MTKKRKTPSEAPSEPVDERVAHVETVIDKILARHPRLKSARDAQPANGRPSGEFVREALATFRGRFRSP
jgi:hypothetical protein